MLGPAFEIVAASLVAGWAQHAALHPLDTLKVRLQYSRGASVQQSARAAMADALRDLELPQGVAPQPPAPGDPPGARLPPALEVRQRSRGAAAARASERAALGDALQNLELPRDAVAKKSRPPRAPTLVQSFKRLPIANDFVEASRIVRQVPARALYAGLWPSLLAVVPTALVYMPTYEAATAALKSFGAPAPLVAPIAGVATGAVCAVVRVPLSVAKSRVQLGLAPSATAALLDAARASGLRGLYVGFGATLALDVAVAAAQFTALDLGRRRLTENSALLGFVASAAGTVLTEPIDVVRTRLMAQLRRGGGGGRGRGTDFGYRSLGDGLAKAVASEGYAALYRGLLPRLILKSLGGAIWYSTYVNCRELFK